MVFINLELGVNQESDKKLTLLQSVFEAVHVSMVKFEGELYIEHVLWLVKCKQIIKFFKICTH